MIPITRPAASNSGLRAFAIDRAAPIWIAVATWNVRVSESIERPIAETTPTESEPCWPNGLPIRDRLPHAHARRRAERHGLDRVVGQ